MIWLVDIFSLVLKNMIEKKKRVFLTISGIIIGIFTFTFFIFLSQGLTNAITEQFGAFGLNVINVQSANSGGGGPPSGSGLSETDISRIEQVVRGYKYVAPGIFHSTNFEFGRDKEILTTLGYPDEYWDEISNDLGIEIEEGRMLRPGDSGVIVLGGKTARDSFDDDPDTIIGVGSSFKFDGNNYRVIGIIKERGDLFVDNAVLTTFDDIKKISGQDTFSVIRVSLEDDTDIDLAEAAILRKLNPNNKEKKVQTTTPAQAIEQFEQIIGVLSMIIGFVSGIALLVGGINVMNTMYSNVLERINEISVMKAIGATNEDIRNIYLTESFILGFTGSIIGFMMAFGLAKGLSYLITNYASYNVPVYWSTGFFFQVVIITAIAAMVFGTYPAIKAAKVNPSDNLRDD